MKKKILTFIILLAAAGAVMAGIHELRRYIERAKSSEDTTTTTDAPIDYSLYYTYGDVERAVDYLADTADVSAELSRLSDPLKQSEPIDVAYIKAISDTIQVPDTVYADVLGKLKDTEYVTKEQFDTIYENIVQAGRVKGLLRQDLFVFDLSKEDPTSFFDGHQTYTAEFDIKSSYEGSVIDVYMKNGKIFKINGLGNSVTTLQNVWVEGVEDGYCTFLYGDTEKTFLVRDDASIPKTEAPVATMSDIQSDESTNYEAQGYIADVSFDYAGVSEITALSDVVRGKVLQASDDSVQVEGMGNMTLDENFRMYNVYEDALPEDSLSLLCGYTDVDLYRRDGKLSAVVINRELNSEMIRVIISNDDYTSYDMDTVSLTATSEYQITYPDGHSISVEAGENVVFLPEEYVVGDKITITPLTHSGRIKLLSVLRECGNPEYDGEIQLDAYDGYFHIINEVSLERYLANVVANEMPSDYPEAALQAMAICARGTAYAKLKDGSYAEYDAHLDDSSLCQVYNNVNETEQSIRAVKDTYGLVPTYRGTLIVPLTFNTSFGTTCTNAEIWGGEAYDYLESNLENLDKDKIDLSQEKDFISFLNNSEEYDIIDKNSAYYRWDVAFSKEDMTEAVTTMLDERKDLTSDSVLILNEAGEFAAGEVGELGTIEKIEVTERTSSGVAAKLVIYGSEQTIEVSGQSHIRTLLSPVNEEIIRQDGSVLSGWTSLPSPYYYVENTKDGFVVHGGGFGHGVGMSIYGAGALAKQGYSYKYILRHYYSYVDFTSIYDVEEAAEESNGD